MKPVRILLATLFALLMLPGAHASNAVQQAEPANTVADMRISTTQISWQSQTNHAGMILSIAAPSGATAQQAFAANRPAVLPITGMKGLPLTDGRYIYELRILPLLSDTVRQQLAAVAEADRAALVAQLRQAGLLPEERVQVGYFAWCDHGSCSGA
jgi:hypothetical protein